MGVGQGSEGEREFIIGGVRMRGGGPVRGEEEEEEEESGGPGGKKRGDRKKRKKKEAKRPAREATKRFVTPRIPPYTRATESYARIPKEDSPPPPRVPWAPLFLSRHPLFSLFAFYFLFSAPSRAHARFHLLSR